VKRFCFVFWVLWIFLIPFAQSQSFPHKPVKIIMPYPGGGPTDILGRLVAQQLTQIWGQNVIIDNRPGGAGLIGASLASAAPADGYTLFLGGVTTLAIAPYVHKNLSYDPLRDFQPISQTTISPLLLMSHPGLPVQTVKQYVQLAQTHPGQINYATSGPGGSGHLAGELFRYVTHVNIVHVPYRGAPPALNDLIAGQVQTMFGSMLAAMPHIRSGKIKAIAITGPQRSVALPKIPTFAQSGYPNYEASTWNGLLAPAGTPATLIDQIHDSVAQVMRIGNLFERLSADGPIAVSSTPQEFSLFIKAEQLKWGAVVRQAHIRID
jgi:tripartite-type tricarboxylate transporter receptor subunit TctC